RIEAWKLLKTSQHTHLQHHQVIVSIDAVSTVAFGGTGARFRGQGSAGCGLLVSFRLGSKIIQGFTCLLLGENNGHVCVNMVGGTQRTEFAQPAQAGTIV
ncbi:hypothetical protein C5167_035897, partial [Papaver somniferum]